MFQAAYSAASGLSAQQKRIDTIADNIANVNSAGYKARRTDFKDAIYSTLPRMVQPQNGINMEMGHGVIDAANNVKYIQGAVNITEHPLDFCLEGDGFFAVEDSAGEVSYTRGDAFSLVLEGDLAYLVTKQGEFVLNNQGERVAFSGRAEDLVVDGNGMMKVRVYSGETIPDANNPGGVIATEEYVDIGRLGIYSFPNKSGLTSIGTGRFQETEVSGAPFEAESYLLHQGALENSNVNIAEEMTRLIRTQRAFQISARALSVADQMEGLANIIRK